MIPKLATVWAVSRAIYFILTRNIFLPVFLPPFLILFPPTPLKKKEDGARVPASNLLLQKNV